MVLTGANSGIGYEAALKLAKQSHTLVLPCRSLDKSVGTARSILEQVPDAKLLPAECDLANLASVRAFAKELPSLVGKDTTIDTVCLNAGLARNAQAKDIVRSVDGFELTGE